MADYRQRLISLRKIVHQNPVLTASTLIIVVAIMAVIVHSFRTNSLNVQTALNGIGVIVALLAVLYSQSRFIQERRDPIKRDIMEMVERWIDTTERQLDVLDGDIGWDSNLHLESGNFENIIDPNELEEVHLEYLQRNHPDLLSLISEFEKYEEQVIETGNDATSIQELVLRYMKIEFQNQPDYRKLSHKSKIITSNILNQRVPTVDELKDEFGIPEVQAGDFQIEVESVIESKRSQIIPHAYNEPPEEYQDYIQSLEEMESYYENLKDELDEVRYDLARQGIEIK